MSPRQESTAPVPGPVTTPLAWAYACTRMECRRAYDRYQRTRGVILEAEAKKQFRAARDAGGLERGTAARIAVLLRERLDLNDPSMVFIALGGDA